MTPLPQKHRNEANKFSISQTDAKKHKKTIKQIATTLIKTTTYQEKKHNVFYSEKKYVYVSYFLECDKIIEKQF